MQQLIIVTLIALGGALGSVLRFLLGKQIQISSNSSFPFGILAVNVIGSFAIGLLATLIIDRFKLDPIWRYTLLVGLLGGFTTFSSFSLDTIDLLRNSMYLQAILYISSSVILSLIATWLGILLANL
jgi:CrcB protein